MSALDRLPPTAREQVTDALTALETSDTPLAADAYPALYDPALRAHVTRELDAVGRVLLERDGTYLSGYADDVADELASAGIGQLDETDRAVLTLVLLHAVAIPRARGQTDGDSWLDAIEFDPDRLSQQWSNPHLTKKAIRTSLRNLRDAGVLRRGHRSAVVPGPQFQRLTDARNELLWSNLVLLAAPDSLLAAAIRRRTATATGAATR
jgi:hypothetical protein